MARPSTITDAQILAAARALFLEKGIRATTAEVARRAGIAEGSIFRRFPTKLDLFRAAMEPEIEEPPWLAELATRNPARELSEDLVHVGLHMIEFFRRILPLVMMAWSNPGPDGLPDLLKGPNPPPLRILKRLTSFFEVEMRAGRLRRSDPEIVARAFFGSVQNYAFFDLLFRAQDELPLPPETFLRGLIALLWNGAAPVAAASQLLSRHSAKPPVARKPGRSKS